MPILAPALTSVSDHQIAGHGCFQRRQRQTLEVAERKEDVRGRKNSRHSRLVNVMNWHNLPGSYRLVRAELLP